jgi:hypothetical protein
MTNFINRTIGADENLLYLGRVHWIYLMTGIVWLACLSLLGWGANLWLWRMFASDVPFFRQEIVWLIFGSRYPWIFWMFLACGFMIFWLHLLKVLATEIALTDQRLVYKTGLILVEIEEIDIAEIRAEKVNHGFFGRFFRYGTIELDSRFVGDIYLPAIHRPHALLKAIHSARKRIQDPLE